MPMDLTEIVTLIYLFLRIFCRLVTIGNFGNHIRNGLNQLLKFMKHWDKMPITFTIGWGFPSSFTICRWFFAMLPTFLKFYAKAYVFMYLVHVRFSTKSSPALLLFSIWSWLGVGVLGFCLLFFVHLWPWLLRNL